MNKSEIIKEYFSMIGKRGASKGGKARTDAMTPKQRVALAKLAAAARWGKKTTKKKGGK
jgi:hypothetical protein